MTYFKYFKLLLDYYLIIDIKSARIRYDKKTEVKRALLKKCLLQKSLHHKSCFSASAFTSDAKQIGINTENIRRHAAINKHDKPI